MVKRWLLFGILLFSRGSLNAQTTPLVVRTDPQTKITSSHTNRLNVIDQAGQFLQIQFSGSTHSIGTPKSPPFEVSLNIFSFAAQELYRQHSRSKLTAYADGEEVSIGIAIYDSWYGQQTMDRGQRVSRQPSFDQETLLPPGSNIERAHGLKDIVMEALVVEEVSIDALIKLTMAQRAEMQLGSVRFQLNEIHRDRLQRFVSSLTPPDYQPKRTPRTPESVNTGVPADTINTPLKETMEWLVSTLSRLSITSGNREHIDFESGAFAKCQFKYSASNASGTQKISYSSDFGDFDPEVVVVAQTPVGVILKYATQDNELKIKEESRSDRNDNHYLYHARSIKLKADGNAADLRYAFVHAIRLCQHRR